MLSRARRPKYRDLDETPLAPNGDAERGQRCSKTPLAAALTIPASVCGALRAHPGRVLAACSCLATLVVLLSGLSLLIGQVLPLVCTQLQIISLEMPDLCVFATPMRLVLRLTSFAPAAVFFSHPSFSLEKPDGTTLIAFDVLGSCTQRRLDDQCHLLTSGSVARRRDEEWGCYRDVSGELSENACVASDGSPAPCYDAHPLDVPLAKLERWLAFDIITHGCPVSHPRASPPPSPPSPSRARTAAAARRLILDRGATSANDGWMKDADVQLIWPGCLQAAIDSACGPSAAGLAMHARRERQMWACYERLNVSATHVATQCVRDGTATPARCYAGDVHQPFTFERTNVIGTYLWSLRAGGGAFVCPLEPYALEEEDDGGGGGGGGGGDERGSAGAKSAASSGASQPLRAQAEPSADARGHARGPEFAHTSATAAASDVPEWLSASEPAPRAWTVERGAADFPLLMSLRIPDERELAHSLTLLATTLGADVGLSGITLDRPPHAGAAPHAASARAAARAARGGGGGARSDDPEEASAPRMRVRLRVALSALGFSFGSREVNVPIPLTHRRAQQLQATVQMLQRRAGCADCSGLHMASEAEAGPLLDGFKLADLHVDKASAERLKVHAHFALRFGEAPQFRVRVPPLSIRLCSTRPWQLEEADAAGLRAAAREQAGGKATPLLSELSKPIVVNEELMRDLGGCLGAFETHGAQLSNFEADSSSESGRVSELHSHLLMRYDGSELERTVPLHSMMKISRERALLVCGTPDDFGEAQRRGDAELAAIPPASSSCALQRLLDRLALRVDLEQLADSVIPLNVIAGLPNRVLVKDALIASTCAVGVLMKVNLPNTTSSQDEDEIGAYCVTAVRDMSLMLSQQTAGMVGRWVRGTTPHNLTGEANGPTVVAMRAVHDFSPVTDKWPEQRLRALNVSADGEDAECRVKYVRDDSARAYKLADPTDSLLECQGKCIEHMRWCHAVEYTALARRCELWYHWPQMVAPSANGSTCLRRVLRHVPIVDDPGGRRRRR